MCYSSYLNCTKTGAYKPHTGIMDYFLDGRSDFLLQLSMLR